MPTLSRGHAWVPLSLGAVLGPALQVQLPALWPIAWNLLLLAACGAGIALLLPRVRAAWWLAALGAGACFAVCGLRASAFVAQRLDPALENTDVVLVGTVAALPQRGEWGQRFRFEVEAAQDRKGRVVRVPPLVSLAWYSSGWGLPAGAADDPRSAPPSLAPGERWRLMARVRAPRGTRNPQGFDYELWLWEQGLQATGAVRAGGADVAPRLLGSSWVHPVESARHAVRAAIQARVLDPQAAGVLTALVVGDQNAIDRTDWDVFRATGVAHLLSISGLHVTMFAWLAAAAVGACWRRSARCCLALPAPHAAALGGVLLAGGYALFSGWGVPAQRTLLMLGSLALLRLSGRRWPWPVGWLVACAIVVTWDPWALLQAGFWLSFVAVGVLFATAPADTAARPGLVQRVIGLLREQGIVTIALAPLTLLLFGQVSIVGLLANLVAIPCITLVVTPLAMAGVLVAPAWDLAGWAAQALVGLLAAMAAWPAAVWTSAAPPLWAGAAGVAGGVLLVARVPAALKAIGVVLLLPALLWQAPRPPPGAFELLAADVGQGNAVLVRTAQHTLLYDAGPRYGGDSDAGQRVLLPLLRAFGERPDLLVLSHRDTDHTGGAASVLRMQPQAALLASLEPDHPLAALRPIDPCAAGREWDWDGVRFTVLHPLAGDPEPRKANAVSCVLRIEAGAQSALLVGDIEAPQEAALLDRGLAPAQVLLVPHHGSRTSSTPAFLDAVRPTWAVVQAGYRNRFGHPAPEVQARYAERGIRVVATPACGAAWWSSATPDVMRCEREAARRYWQAPDSS